MNAEMDAWRTPPARLALSAGDVHVWRIRLDAGDDAIARYRALLAPDEQARAARLPRRGDRDRYTAAHGALRDILSRYLGADARALRFDYGPHGKPELKGAVVETGEAIAFNLAHSAGLALCAVAAGRAVGVDIERIRPALAAEHIAERFFAANEVATLRGLPGAEQPLAFFRCWTRKEAFIKALGRGLAYPLNRFEVSLAPDEPPALLAIADAPDEVADWTLHELHPGPGYIAALAVAGHGWRLATWGI